MKNYNLSYRVLTLSQVIKDFEIELPAETGNYQFIGNIEYEKQKIKSFSALPLIFVFFLVKYFHLVYCEMATPFFALGQRKTQKTRNSCKQELTIIKIAF